MNAAAVRKAAWRARKREAGEPVEDREVARLRKAAYRAKLRASTGLPRQVRKPRGQKPFLAIDGEGCGRNRKGQQHYMLLCAGNADVDYELFTGKPLGTAQIFDFICNLPPDVILTGFSIGYDITMWLRDLPPTNFDVDPPAGKRQDILADKDDWKYDDTSRFVKPLGRYTWWRDFGIWYVPNNFFRVCRMETVTVTTPDGITWIRPRPVKGSARTIYEGFGLFQRRFARALQDFKIGTYAERLMIARNKAERASFSRITRTIRDYCAMECSLHAQMMETLRENCLAAGIKPATWNGPGKMATVLHKSNATMTADRLRTWVPSGLLQMADAAYYGGRFELRRIGLMTSTVYAYDINSAYPAAMQELPCLEHGKWTYADGEQIRRLHADPTALYVATIAYQHTLAAGCRGMCGLPHRHSGREMKSRRQWAGVLAWPLQGQGTYWSVEIRSAETLGARFKFGSGWTYERQCDCRPFDWIAPLYQARLALGKSTVGYPLKLAINSLYGKLAQRIGQPQFANAIWAGLITAITRARLNRAIALNPEAIAMIATDGIYSVAPLALPLSKQLGDWEESRMDRGMFTAQPGLYWPLDARPKVRTRGISAGYFKHYRRKRFERAWSEYAAAARSAVPPPGLTIPAVNVPIHVFIGMPLAEARGNSDLAGCWHDVGKTISFDWHGKRGLHQWQEGPHVTTLPIPGGIDWVSASYDAESMPTELGDLAGEDFEDQPDYLQFLDTD